MTLRITKELEEESVRGNQRSYSLTALSNGEEAGTLELDIIYGTKGHIEDIYVDPNYRGRGVGKALVKQAEKISWSFGAKGLTGELLPEGLAESRQAAKEFWLKHGFTVSQSGAIKKPLVHKAGYPSIKIPRLGRRRLRKEGALTWPMEGYGGRKIWAVIYPPYRRSNLTWLDNQLPGIREFRNSKEAHRYVLRQGKDFGPVAKELLGISLVDRAQPEKRLKGVRV